MDDRNEHLDTDNQKNIQKSALNLIKEWVSAHLDESYRHISTALFQQSETASDNQQQTRLFQTYQELDKNQVKFSQQFLKTIDHAFQLYLAVEDTSQGFATETSTEEPLQLVDNEALEQNIALSTLNQRSSADCSELLYTLNQRLAVIRGGYKLINSGNPIAPAVFCDAIRNSCQQLQLDHASSLVIFRLFNESFLSRLNKLYNLLNHHLESLGVLPNLNFHIEKNDDRQALPEELAGLFSQDSDERQLDLIAAISQIRELLLASKPKPAAGTTLPLAELIESLSQLQHASGEDLQPLATPEAFTDETIAQRRHQIEDSVANADPVDADMVELVGLLFEYMLNDEQLPTSVKTLLSYLHTPYIRLALMDSEFFRQPQHPARQLLNILVAAGERWVEPLTPNKNEVFLKIKATVQRILDDFQQDPRLFTELAFEFNQYLRQHARRIRLAEKRAREAAEGENRLREIRLKVELFVKRKLGQLKMSSEVERLLFEPWANFLAFNLLRFGSDSSEWRDAAKVVDDVIWYTRMPAFWHDTSRVSELSQLLPVMIQIGFETVGYDSRQGETLLQALQRDHQQLAGETDHPYIPTLTTIPDTRIDDIDVAAELASQREPDPLLPRLAALEAGTWFEFNSDKPEQQHRVRLAWSNPDSMHFLFVNRMGQQVAIKSGPELADEIRKGHTRALRVLEGKPFFEKALQSVLTQMQQEENTR